MDKSESIKAQQVGLFRSVGLDGTHWLLTVRPDDGWNIMRDGRRFSVGAGNCASIDYGVRRFLSLTVARGPLPEAPCV